MDDDLYEAYDKEWALKDQTEKDGYESGVEKDIEQNKIEVVKRLYDKNFTPEDIAEIVDMKVEDVLKLSE